MRTHRVVVESEAIELGLQFLQGACAALLDEPALERLVEPLYLPAGLGVVGPRATMGYPQGAKRHLHRASSTSRCAREHCTVVGQHRSREPMGCSCDVEGLHDVERAHHPADLRSHEQPGVIIDHVQDLDTLTPGKLPVRDVCLPKLVRQVGLEADERALGPFLGLGNDEASSRQDPPDRGRRRSGPVQLVQVIGDRVRPASSP